MGKKLGLTLHPFFAGMGFKVPHDCDEARKAIAAFKLTDEYKGQRSFHTLMEAGSFVGYLKQFGVIATVDDTGRVSGGIPGAVRVEGIQEISKPFLLSPGKDSEDTCEDPGWVFRTPGPGQLPYDVPARGYVAVTRLFDAYFG
jgi:hypothetical protein